MLLSSLVANFPRNVGASYIASTLTAKEMLQLLGVDCVIDYMKENWWEILEFVSDPFDVILDAVGGREPWLQAIKTKTVKNGWNGGRYVVMNGDEPLMQIHNWLQTLKFLFRLYGRSIWTLLWPRIPKYIWHEGLDLKPGHLEELGKL